MLLEFTDGVLLVIQHQGSSIQHLLEKSNCIKHIGQA
jgi:hypothetical protein